MRTRRQGTAQLGDVVAAAFDAAARYTSDPRKVAQLAARVVGQMRRPARRVGVRPILAT